MSVFVNSINQFCYGADRSDVLPNKVDINGKSCYYSANTEMRTSSRCGTQVVIIGTCIDLSENAFSDVCAALCEMEYDRFLQAIDKLCGAYVIFRAEGASVKVFGDASHFIGVYYGVGERYKGIVSSCEALIVDKGECVSSATQEVIDGAYSGGLYLAGDITLYDSVKCLLANHYLDLSNNCPIRYFPREELTPAKDEDEVNAIIDKTLGMVKREIEVMGKKYAFASPLTPGGDSRVNSALLRNTLPEKDVYYYVITNIELQREPDNLKFIKTLACEMGIREFHTLLEEDHLDDEGLRQLKAECGGIRAFGKRLWCYNSQLGKRAIVKGELIDQIGKSPYGRAMPEWMASEFFLKTILSNTSRQAGIEFHKWYKNARTSRKGYSMFDLYSWEIRCGRWNSNTHSIANILGVENINFYNCAYILSEWCRIPRSMRTKKCIHKRFISKTMPNVLNYPTNPFAYRHSKHLAPFLSKIVPFWCRWMAQYWIHKAKSVSVFKSHH